MTVKLIVPDPRIVLELPGYTELRITPYVVDPPRLHFQVVRTEKMGKPSEIIVTYFDIGLDDLHEVLAIGNRLVADKARQLS